MALAEDHQQLFAWGSNRYGECGHGQYVDALRPKLVEIPYEEERDERIEIYGAELAATRQSVK